MPIGPKAERGHAIEPMDLLADTRRSLAQAIRQLEAINNGVAIVPPLTRDDAINVVTEQIGVFESVLRRYKRRDDSRRIWSRR